MKPLVNNQFHLVSVSPWPLLTSLSIGSIGLGAVIWLHYFNCSYLLVSFICLILCMVQWWRDVLRESTYQGAHTLKVQNGLKMGFLLFLLSEVMFFFSVFWALFHLSSFPGVFSGSSWPSDSIVLFNPKSIPLLNTLILITSGFVLSWAHYSFLSLEFKMFKYLMISAISLGGIFSLFQLYEYWSSYFSISDSIYGTVFFFSTGFHGIHVIVGTTMLIVSLIQMLSSNMSFNQMMFFDFSSWYWHFVDIIWIILYIFLYFIPW